MENEKTPPVIGRDGAEQLSQVVDLLTYLKIAVDELRARLAGATKAHYSVDEVAKLVARSPYTVRQWVHAGRIKAVRVSGTGPKGRLLIPRDQLDRLIESGLGGAIPAVATSQGEN